MYEAYQLLIRLLFSINISNTRQKVADGSEHTHTHTHTLKILNSHIKKSKRNFAD